MEGFSARDRTCQGTGGQPWNHRGPLQAEHEVRGASSSQVLL